MIVIVKLIDGLLGKMFFVCGKERNWRFGSFIEKGKMLREFFRKILVGKLILLFGGMVAVKFKSTQVKSLIRLVKVNVEDNCRLSCTNTR